MDSPEERLPYPPGARKFNADAHFPWKPEKAAAMIIEYWRIPLRGENSQPSGPRFTAGALEEIVYYLASDDVSAVTEDGPESASNEVDK